MDEFESSVGIVFTVKENGTLKTTSELIEIFGRISLADMSDTMGYKVMGNVIDFN